MHVRAISNPYFVWCNICDFYCTWAADSSAFLWLCVICCPSVETFHMFELLLRNRWMEFYETWQEASTQRPLPSLCFRTDRKTKMAPWTLIGWFNFDFSSATAERNLMKVTGSKYAQGPLPMATRSLVGWVILDFFSKTTERNLAKLDWEQDLNVLYYVCFSGFGRASFILSETA